LDRTAATAPEAWGRSLSQLITAHGTAIFADPKTGALRHGSRQAVPANVWLIRDRGGARLSAFRDGQEISIACSPQAPFPAGVAPNNPATQFELVNPSTGGIALRAHGHFLCAEADGRVTLSRPACGDWETFGEELGVASEPRVAVFTMAYNESLFLPTWLRHYGEQFGRENLYVLDNGGTDGSTENLGEVSVVRVPRPAVFDEERRAAFVSWFQASLLCYYDVVIFCDTDEFLVANPAKYAGLRDYVARRNQPVITAVGLDVVHVPEVEPPLDLSRPILEQRSFAQFNSFYCKPLVTRAPVRWAAGFHGCQMPPAIDPDLYLLHLKRMDLEWALVALNRVRSIAWSPSAVAQRQGEQFRLSDAQFTAQMFPPRDLAAISEDFDFTAELAQIPRTPYGAVNIQGNLVRMPAELRSIPLGIPDGLVQTGVMRAGLVAMVGFEGGRTRFAVDDPADHIQAHHCRGLFYEQRQMLAHLEVIPLGCTVLDIGANVGNHTLFYAHYSHAYRIYPFEPNPRARDLLLKSIELNPAAAPRIDLSHVSTAVGARKSLVSVSEMQVGNLGGTSFTVAEGGDFPCLPLDDLTFEGEIGFIKIDVEGMELDVLSGARKLLERHRPVLYVEVNRVNEPAFWAWLETARYEPVGGSFHYPTVKNYLLFPRS
jgi:FkbM family methyltransferase